MKKNFAFKLIRSGIKTVLLLAFILFRIPYSSLAVTWTQEFGSFDFLY